MARIGQEIPKGRVRWYNGIRVSFIMRENYTVNDYNYKLIIIRDSAMSILSNGCQSIYIKI